jgi:hypothetical protein
MSGLMRRITRGRAATGDEATPDAPVTSEAASDATNAQPGDPAVPSNGTAQLPTPAPAAEQGTAVLPPEPDGRDLPAGVDPGQLAAAPTSARRGRLRRRVRYLRAVREILLRDLGGFYYEAQRSEQGADGHRRLLDAKAARLATLDAELQELEARLGDPRSQTVLREPGIGGTCPQCGELYASNARFCSRCGAPLGGRNARRAATPTVPPVTSRQGEKETTASLWGRPMRPEASDAPDAPAAAGDGAATKADAPTKADPATAADAPTAINSSTPDTERDRT